MPHRVEIIHQPDEEYFPNHPYRVVHTEHGHRPDIDKKYRFEHGHGNYENYEHAIESVNHPEWGMLTYLPEDTEVIDRTNQGKSMEPQEVKAGIPRPPEEQTSHARSRRGAAAKVIQSEIGSGGATQISNRGKEPVYRRPRSSGEIARLSMRAIDRHDNDSPLQDEPAKHMEQRIKAHNLNTQQQKQPTDKQIKPHHAKAIHEAAKFLEKLATEKAFGLPHQHNAHLFKAALDPLISMLDEEDVEHPDSNSQEDMQNNAIIPHEEAQTEEEETLPGQMQQKDMSEYDHMGEVDEKVRGMPDDKKPLQAGGPSPVREHEIHIEPHPQNPNARVVRRFQYGQQTAETQHSSHEDAMRHVNMTRDRFAQRGMGNIAFRDNTIQPTKSLEDETEMKSLRETFLKQQKQIEQLTKVLSSS